MKRRSRQTTTRPSFAPAAELTASIAPAVLHAVVHDRRRLAPAMAAAFKTRERVKDIKDRSGITRSLRALLRWWGWIETLHLRRADEQLLLASMLEYPEVTAFARVWAGRIGRPIDRLVPVGDAPSWTGRAEGLKRWLGVHAVNADPWRLFPSWMREQVPVPPGEATPKMRRLGLPRRPAIAKPRLGGRSRRRRQGRLDRVARGRAEAVGPPAPRGCCQAPAGDRPVGVPLVRGGPARPAGPGLAGGGARVRPRPGRAVVGRPRRGGGGVVALHLAALMGGKGAVICTFDVERRRHDAALRLRRAAFRNVTTRLRDGQHPTGKAASFDGVVVEPPFDGDRHLAPPPRRTMDNHPRADPRIRGRPASPA